MVLEINMAYHLQWGLAVGEWVRSSLLKQGSIWAVKDNTCLGSWMWKKVLKYRDIAKSLYRTEIKNGARTSFWFDNWSDMGRLIDIAGDRGIIDMGIAKHATVAEAWTNRRRRRHRVNYLNQMEEILSLKWQSQQHEEDRVLWRGKNDAFHTTFSTKDTWNHTRTTTNKVAWYKGVWFAQAIPKLAFCMWLAVQNRLSTGDRMVQWNMGVEPTCVLCNSELENRDHIFFSCSYAKEVWEPLAKTIYKTRYTTDWQAIIHSVSNHWPNRIEGFLARCVLQATIHTIWRERNERKHGNHPSPAVRLVKWIDKHIRNHISAINLSGDRRYDGGLQIWFQTRETS